MTEPKYIRVINNRASGHVLPPVGDFPGRTLLPGGNNVEAEYLDALRESMDADVHAVDPATGAHVVNAKGEPVILRKRAGSYKKMLDTNDHLTLLTPEESAKETKKPEGPPPPPNLLDRQVELAEAFVEVESDPKTLNRWLKADNREEVKRAIGKRLQELKVAK